MLFGYDETHCKHEICSKKETEDLLKEKSEKGHTHTWNQIESKPTTFTPSSHTHDDRYFTETEVNNKLAQYKLKGDFAVISGTLSASGGEGNTTVNYPSGFSKDNCVVISVICQFSSSVQQYSYNHISGASLIGAKLATANIEIRLSKYENSGPTGNLPFKIVLMKV